MSLAQYDTAEDIKRSMSDADANQGVNSLPPPPRPSRRLRLPIKTCVAGMPGGPLLLTTATLHVYCHIQDNNREQLLAIDRMVRARGAEGGRKLIMMGEGVSDWEIALCTDLAALPSQEHNW